MTWAQFTLGALVLLPVLTSALAVAAPRSREGQRRLGAGLGVLTAVALVALMVPLLWTVTVDGDVIELALGGYQAPLGIHLRADGLSVAFLALSVIVGGIVSVYAAAMPQAIGHRRFWPLWLACWGGLHAVFVSGDLFNTYVGLELVGMTAVGLVAIGGRDSWQAALRYLFVAVLGSLLLLLGIGLLVSVTGTLDVMQIREVLAGSMDQQRPAVVLALGLITVGMGLKVALMPFHAWLIPAHAGAPSAVSALLSALVIKAPVFVLLRLWLWVVPQGEDLRFLSLVLSVLGATAIIAGAVLALRQSRLKPLIAYSTVAQVGYWFLFAALIGGASADSLTGMPGADVTEDEVISSAVVGTVALVLGHGVAKAAMFLAAGFLKDLYGTDEIARLRGVGRHHPGLVMAMGLAAVGLAGLPISLSFSGKWLVTTSAVATGEYWVVGVIVVGTVLSSAYLVTAIAPLLVESEDEGTAVELPKWQLDHTPALTQWAPLVLGLLTVGTGFLGAWLGGLLEVGAPW